MVTGMTTNPTSSAQHRCYTLRLDVQEGRGDEFIAIFAPLAEATRKEPGVIQYDLLRALKDPNEFNLIQRYASAEAVKAHMEQPYTVTAMRDLGQLLRKPFVQTDYVPVG
jgi:quinol monooxygenase YgiN